MTTELTGSVPAAAQAPAAAPTQTQEATSPANEPKKLSFRDLDESLEEQQNALDEQKVKEVKEGALEDGDDDLSDDEDSDDLEDADEEKEEDEDGEEEEAPEEDGEEKEELHEVKVNGKLKKYTLDQMKNLVSSGVHLLETYQQFEGEKQKFTQEITKKKEFLDFANEKITPAWTALEKGDVEGALLHLASVKGSSKLEVRRKLREAMIPIVGARLGLTAQEVQTRLVQNQGRNQVWDTAEENEFLKAEQVAAKTTAQKQKDPDPSAQAEAQLKQLQTKHGVGDWEVSHAVDWLLEHGVAEQDLSLDSMFNVVQQRRMVDKAFDAIKAVKPSLEKDEKFVDRVVQKIKKNPNWTIPDAAQWVRKTIRKEASTKAQNNQGDALRLAKDIGEKVLRGNAKSRLESPSTQPRKIMSFRDYESDDSLS